jgi:hypothetical protein
MQKISVFIFGVIIFIVTAIAPANIILAQETTVKGIVFYDRTGNGQYDKSGDKPLKGVAVSNGRDVVLTGRDGVYELPLRENCAIFVIKPRNWSVPVDENQLPRFYHLHSPEGLTGSKYSGLSPTGHLPDRVNFPLYREKEPNAFNVLVFGDTQARDEKEIYYMSRDVISEIRNVDAAFGITLGDVVFDNLTLYDHIVETHAATGIPWRYIAGNHDNDYSGNNTDEARGVWYRTFGPTYYSFTYGPAHFIVLDNIRWIVDGDERYYRTGLGEDQMEFLKNEIERLDSDQLLVLLSHIPYERSTAWADMNEKLAFYSLLASHPNTVSLAAHTHQHYHQFIGKESGFPGEKPHHLVSMGTVCGAWWTGAPDEYGIPHAMMSDGTPNSYGYLLIDRNNWKLQWKAASRPDNYQMYIDAPDFISPGNSEKIKVNANIYNALPTASVRMKIGKQGEWIQMDRTVQNDPSRLAVMEREKELGKVPWRPLGAARTSEHIWTAEKEIDLSPGVYIIYVESVDDWWHYEGRRLLHVK